MAVQADMRGDLSRKRIGRAFGIILLCYLGLVARLLFLQVREGQAIHAEATRIRRQTIVIPAQRGSICDRNGRPLAVSLFSGTVGFDARAILDLHADPKKAERQEAALADSIRRLAGLLGMPQSDVAAKVAEARARYPRTHNRFFVIKKDAAVDVAQRVRDMRPPLLGFGIEDGARRYYTSGDNAAQVVGFVSSEGFGKAGLERACSKWLTGRKGLAVAEMDERHREIPDTRQKTDPARDGYDVQTTLDADAQHIVTDEAKKIVDLYHPVGVSIVVVDPMTGDLIALVSMPTYDPNPGKSATITAMSQWERCATTLYEPGSTLKALTLAAALDDGTITPNNHFVCTGHLQIGRKTIHCAHGEVHGSCNAEEILRHSCNIGAAQVGMKMGPERLFAADKRFGLFEKYDIGLPGEKAGRLSFDHRENVYSQAKCARVAFGQSITTTPLHVAMAYASLVNGGILMRPHLIGKVTDSGGRIVRQWDPQPIRHVISAETSARLSSMLRSVVEDGTGKIAAIPGYRVGGKTGTAQKYHVGKYVGSFVGFIPASPNVKPRAVILVAVDEPQGKHYGADVAAPAFRNIAGRLMAVWKVPEDDPEGTQAKLAAENLKHAGHVVTVAVRPHDHD